MPAMGLWIQHDQASDPRPNIHPEDECFYARQLKSHGGYGASTCNQLIENFKKSGDKKGTGEWYWRNQAVGQFAREVGEWLGAGHLVTNIPPAKFPTNPKYSSRFEDLFAHLKIQRPDLDLRHLIRWREERIEDHRAPRRATVDEVYRNCEIVQAEALAGRRTLILLDDVLTKGTHFSACKRRLLEVCPDLRVIGAFWAKAVNVLDDP